MISERRGSRIRLPRREQGVRGSAGSPRASVGGTEHSPGMTVLL
jgi:hypothetical protein